MGWLENYQIRLWLRSWDKVPLFLLPGLTMSCCWGLAVSPAAALPVPVPCPCFLGSWALGKGCPSPASTPSSSSWTWHEWVPGSRSAGRGSLPARGTSLILMELVLGSAERGSNPTWPLATRAILGKPPGLCEVWKVCNLRLDGLAANEVRRQLGKGCGVGAQPHRLGVSSCLCAETRDSVVVVAFGLGFEN